MMNITIEQLIDAIENAIARVDVMVPDQDYYAKRGNSSEGSIDIVCPYKLIEALKELEK